MERTRAVAVANAVAVLAVLGGCNQIFGLEPADRTDAAVDAPDEPTTDGGLGPWNNPVPISAFATTHHEEDPHLSDDGLELYASFLDAASPTAFDIVFSRRQARSDPWPEPVAVAEVRSTSQETTPTLGEEGRLLLFATNRPGGFGGNDIWAARRDASGAEWSTPDVIADAQLNSMANDRTAARCLGDTHTIFASDRIGNQTDLYEIVNGLLIRIEAASSDTFLESSPFVTEDCLTVYFSSNLTGTRDIYVMTRESADEPFGNPQRLDDVSTTTANETDPWVSADGRHIVFASDRAGTYDLYEAFR